MNRHDIKNAPLRYGRFLVATLAALVSFSGLVHAQKMVIPASDGVEVVPNIDLTNDQLVARFLDQATAGATPEEIASLSAALTAHPDTAFSDWINDQYTKPVLPDDLSLTIINKAIAADGGALTTHVSYDTALGLRGSLMISDKTNELRRKVAYALSQIFVISTTWTAPLRLQRRGHVRLL